MTALPPDTMDKIAEYLALMFYISVDRKPGQPKALITDYTRVNHLGAYLQMTLPAALWGKIVRGVQKGNVTGWFDAIEACRQELGTEGSLKDDDTYAWSWIGFTKPKPQ